MTSSRPVSACDNKTHNSPQLQPDTNIYQAAASAGTRSSPSRCWAAAVARRHLQRPTRGRRETRVTWRAGLEFPGYVVQSHDNYMDDHVSNAHTSATMQAPATTAARSGPPPATTTTTITTLCSRPDSHRSRAPIVREEGEQLPARAVSISEASPVGYT